MTTYNWRRNNTKAKVALIWGIPTVFHYSFSFLSSRYQYVKLFW